MDPWHQDAELALLREDIRRVTALCGQLADSLQRVKDFAVRDASYGDDRLLHLMHELGLITEAEAGGWLSQWQHPTYKLIEEHRREREIDLC